MKQRLNTTRESDQESDSDDEAVHEAFIADDAEGRASLVIDMLSIFDKGMLPAEYGSSLPEVSTDAALQEVVRTRNLGATIYGLAVRHESLYLHLRTIITHDICNDAYLAKQERRFRQAIEGLDQRLLEVWQCGEELRRIVNEICDDRAARTLERPPGLPSPTRAAELLVEILGCVSKHSGGFTGEMPPTRTLLTADTDLYTFLIGHPSLEDDFIVDQLINFPPAEWRHLVVGVSKAPFTSQGISLASRHAL